MNMNTLEEHLDASSHNTAYNVRLRLAFYRIHTIPPHLCQRSFYRTTSSPRMPPISIGVGVDGACMMAGLCSKMYKNAKNTIFKAKN